MNLLLEKYLDFKELDRYEFEYMPKDGRKLTFIIRKDQFPHLIGIHKLVDIPIVARFNDSNDKRIKAIDMLSSIRNEKE